MTRQMSFILQVLHAATYAVLWLDFANVAHHSSQSRRLCPCSASSVFEKAKTTRSRSLVCSVTRISVPGYHHIQLFREIDII